MGIDENLERCYEIYIHDSVMHCAMPHHDGTIEEVLRVSKI